MTTVARHGVARGALERVEAVLDRSFGAAGNPLRHLGALAYASFWLIAGSGLYLYIFFDTSSTGAWRSVRSLQDSVDGGLARGVHRYASDAFLLICLLHLLREWILGRYRGVRWFTWVSGVPLLWLTWLAGVVGFWLVWDELGAFSAGAMLEWLDALGVFSEPLPRNILSGAQVDDRLFSLFVFTHIGLSLLLLLGLWLHTQRLTRPDNIPAPSLLAGLSATLIIAALVQPASLGRAADLYLVPAQLAFDWFYLAPQAVQYLTSPKTMWIVLLLLTAALSTLPWWPGRPEPAVIARVDPEHCNGCARCFVDCPYAAVTMVPTPERKGLRQLAVVDGDLCAGCGICAGACPSSTPFRTAAALVSGIDMPQLGVGTLRESMRQSLAVLREPGKILLIGCDHGADVSSLSGEGIASMSLLCAGQLPPAFVEYALRAGASGVVVVACAEGGCEFRLGERWTAQRLTGQRDPYLRASVDPGSWILIHAGRTELPRVVETVKGLRARVEAKAAHG